MGSTSMTQSSHLPSEPAAGADVAAGACPSCGYGDLSVFYEVHQVPVHSCLLLPTAQAAREFPRGDIALGFCGRCGFITNVAFDSTVQDYSPDYEDQQSYSPTFNAFARGLAGRLIDKYDLREKDIVEIGCSKGDFLLLLCELGHNRGVGIDPSAVAGRVQSPAAERVQFIQDYYSERYASRLGDLICCRHTLEHIHGTASFVRTVRRSIGDRLDTVVFFELPDASRVLRELAFWDVYYEHCSYFTPGSLGRLFRACGFEVVDLAREYGSQYLLLEARPVRGAPSGPHELEETAEHTAQDVRTFSRQVQAKLREWESWLVRVPATGKRTIVWGSGSKCVAFLTTVGHAEAIDYVVDINPYRHGKFIPGIGKEIMAPEVLRAFPPEQIVVMNSLYCDEIRQMLDGMGIAAELVPL
jgi:SAM-dependent methyltransferase